MIYLNIKEIRNFWHLLFNYKKIKQGDLNKERGTSLNIFWFKKMQIKIIAKLGSLFHFLGAVIGYFQYKKTSPV